MKTSLECVPCLVRQALEAARNATSNPYVQEQVLREMLRLTAALDLGRPPPFLVQLTQRRLRELTGVEDPYRPAKSRFNRLALEALPHLAEVVRRAADPVLAAARCAVAANAIDMGTASALTDADVRSALRGLPDQPVHGDWAAFLQAAAGAKDILYLADNAGEVAVDRLAIEALGPRRVTVAVRGSPVLNDATLEDAREVGLLDLVAVIDNGSDAPGTILDDCRPTFRRHFERADLVIAKGQGNFETLSGAADNIAFWFKVKCPIVSRDLGLAVGTHVLLPPAGRRSSRQLGSAGGAP